MTDSSATARWLTFFQPRRDARLRLFCFPYAGAGTSAFREWAAALPNAIDVCGVQYPGRGTRADEPPFEDLTHLVDALMPAILPCLDRPFVFFGHSMGALIAFELIRALAPTGVGPEHAFFSGSGAPQIPEPHPIHHLPDRELLDALVQLNGIPPEVLRRADLVEYMLPILRADFTACETYRHRIGAPLRCPVTVFGGEHDGRVDRPRLDAWREHATVYFSSTIFAGDHFFLRTAQAALLRAVVRELQPLVEAASLA